MVEVVLIEGDCTQKMQEVADNSIDLVVTSPPYAGIELWGETPQALAELNLKALEQCAEKLKIGGVICWNIADVFCGGSVINNVGSTVSKALELKLNYMGRIIWNKGITRLQIPHFLKRPIVPNLSFYEDIIILQKGERTIREERSGYPQHYFKPAIHGIWRISAETSDIIKNPCPYPLELARRLVMLFSMENDTILDPFMGSGTTGVACKQLNRNFIGIEIDGERYEEAKKRINESEKPVTSFFT